MTSFGASLRRERELRAVSLHEISASTKIGVRMLQAIEDDRLDKLPQGLFVRGFVLEYARFLGLDEQKVLTDLSFHLASTQAQGEPAVPEKRGRVSTRLSAGLVNAGLAVGVAGTVAILIMSPNFSSGRSTSPAALPPVNAPLVGAEAAGSGRTVATAGVPVLSGAQNPAPSVLPQPLQLTLTATEDCWIGLDVGGDRVENRVLKKGESFSVIARQNASLAVGNAGGLLVAIDRGPGRPLGNRGEVKRNIPLSPEAISALSAGSENTPPKPIG
jgi:cytoskeletal protein RodZ